MKDKSRKEVFFKGLGISLLIHIIVFFLFQIEITSDQLSSKNLAQVTFIGAILPSLTSAQVVKTKFLKFPQGLHRKKIEFKQTRLPKPLVEKEVLNSDIPAKPNIGLDAVEPLDIITKFSFSVPTKVPLEIEEKEIDLVDSGSSMWQGDLSERGLMYKPKVLELKDLILLYSNYSIPVLKIEVLPGGRVQNVTILKTSGNFIIDIALKNYIRKWIFEPISVNRKEEGRIIFDLTQLERIINK